MTRQRGQGRRIALVLLAGASAAACTTLEPRYATHAPAVAGPAAKPTPGARGTYKPYQVAGIWYVPREQPNYDQKGLASWYGDAFHMKATANGEVFDMTRLSAAHTTLPLPSIVEVTNLDNGRKLRVRVNDRGPFVNDRIIDLSHAAARELGYDRAGLAHVRVRYVGPAPLAGPEAGLRYAQAKPVAPPPATAPAAVPIAPVFQTVSLVAAPAAVQVAPLAPPVQPPATYRIQAGAFSDQANAQRAAAQLSVAGQAVIEPTERDGATLYRVLLAGGADEAEAFALRDRVAQIGFTDARVVRPF